MLTKQTLCYTNFVKIKAYQGNRLKNTIIDKTLTYTLETWLLTKRDRKQINIFERKVHRRISGPVYDNEKRKLEDINQ
jgi:hypothetical protein